MAVNTSTGFAALLLANNSFEGIFDGGSIAIYTGAQPASADEPATGVLLGRITRDGGTWIAGNPANGLRFDRVGRYAMKRIADSWQLTAIETGVAGWGRLVANAEDDGDASLNLPRIDMAVGVLDDTGDAQLRMPDTSVSTGQSVEFLQWLFLI